MNKKFIAVVIAAILLSVTAMSACQPTPENEVVVNKNEGNMEEAIQDGADTLVKQLEDVPQQYKNTLTKANVTVNFDAEVDKIDSNIFPVWTAGKYQFTQSDADNIAKVLIPPEAKVYDNWAYNKLTKSEIQDRILNCKGEIDHIKKLDDDVFLNEYGEDETRESAIQWVNDQIDYYESMYNDAPDEKLIVESDLVFKDTVNGKAIYVYVKNTENSNPVDFSVFRDHVQYGNDETTLLFALFDNEFVIQDSKTMGITLKEAESQASSALREMGIDNMTVVSSGLINSSKQDEVYFVKFQRILDNKYVFKNIETAPQMNSGNETETGPLMVEYSEVLDPEELTVMINKEGIVDLFWMSAKGNFNKITENVKLLSFDEIIKKAEDNIFYKIYADKEDKVTINIDSIELNYMCIKQKDSAMNLLVIPVWDFSGFQNEMKFGFRLGGCYLTLNAIDGTVINRQLGY